MNEHLAKARKEAKILRMLPVPGANKIVKTISKTTPKTYATPKKVGAATTPDGTNWKTTTYTPKRVSPMRLGAEDFLKWPSRDGKNLIYPQGESK